jgi:hypothetical protein
MHRILTKLNTGQKKSRISGKCWFRISDKDTGSLPKKHPFARNMLPVYKI